MSYTLDRFNSKHLWSEHTNLKEYALHCLCQLSTETDSSSKSFWKTYWMIKYTKKS